MSENTAKSDGDRPRGEEEQTRRWRETAYLKKENWPEAIPAEGPQTRYGVYAWGKATHDQYGIDKYPWNHPDAASIGYDYWGDVCPMCGIPLNMEEMVITKTGKRGELYEVSESEDPEPSYHPHCYDKRQEILQKQQMEAICNA